MSSLAAQDIMKTEVLFAYEGWAIKYLANFFKKHNITGAPVFASDHELVGVVSVTDVFNFENQPTDGKVEALRDYYQSAYGNDLNLADLERWSLTAEENCTVHQIMQKHVIAVAPTTPIPEVCRTMLDNKIHRVFVTEDNKVSGVISTSDVLKLLAEN